MATPIVIQFVSSTSTSITARVTAGAGVLAYWDIDFAYSNFGGPPGYSGPPMYHEPPYPFSTLTGKGTDPDGYTHIFDGLLPGRAYVIRAVDAGGLNRSNMINITTGKLNHYEKVYEDLAPLAWYRLADQSTALGEVIADSSININHAHFAIQDFASQYFATPNTRYAFGPGRRHPNPSINGRAYSWSSAIANAPHQAWMTDRDTWVIAAWCYVQAQGAFLPVLAYVADNIAGNPVYPWIVSSGPNMRISLYGVNYDAATPGNPAGLSSSFNGMHLCRWLISPTRVATWIDNVKVMDRAPSPIYQSPTDTVFHYDETPFVLRIGAWAETSFMYGGPAADPRSGGIGNLADIGVYPLLTDAQIESFLAPATVATCSSGIRATFFADDDVTPLYGTLGEDGISVDVASFYSAPDCPRPYLKRPEAISSSKVDFRNGRSEIGAVNLEIIDFPTDPADASTGILSAIADKLPYSRVLVEQYVAAGVNAWLPLFDGVVFSMELDERLVTWKIETRDIREREVNRSLFSRNETATIYPEGGTAEGYFKNSAGNFYVPPARAARGNFQLIGDSDMPGRKWGYFQAFAPAPLGHKDSVALKNSPFQKFLPLGYAEPVNVIDETSRKTFPHIAVRWKLTTAGAPWTVLRDMHQVSGVGIAPVGNAFFVGGAPALHADPDGTWFESVVRVLLEGPAASLPPHNSTIDFQALSADTTNDDVPFYFEGTFGQLLKNIYDGAYSIAPPRIRYDDASMADFVANTPIARLFKTDSVDDMRRWVEENIYKPLGAAPLIDENGKIRPSYSRQPDQAATLLELNQDNVTVVSDWKWETEDAVSAVVFNYTRDFLRMEDGRYVVIPRDVQIVHQSVSSRLNMPLEYSPETVHAIGGIDGNPDAGGVDAEVGAQLAKARAAEMLGRFPNGSLRIGVRGRSNDFALQNIRVGDWRALHIEYLPDVTTLKRDMRRVVQIVGCTPLINGWVELELLDAGPNAPPPVGSGAAGAPTVGADGRASIVVTTVPAGTLVRVEYAFATAEPGPNDAAWQLLAVVDTAPQTLYTPVVPTGFTVYSRLRTETLDSRPGPWTPPASSGTPAAPVAIQSGTISIDAAAVPVVTWVASPAVLGVRIYYHDHTADTAPVLSTFLDVAASAGTANLPFTVNRNADPGREISVKLEPWASFPISGGAAGLALSLSIAYGKDVSDASGGGAAGGKVPFIKRDGTHSDIPLVA